VDTHPIKSVVQWLAGEAGSIPAETSMERPMSELNDLKRRIAAGEYRLDANAIAEAMFSRADSLLVGERRSQVLEAREGDSAPGGVE
jgi:HAMP domain-containing protein